MPSPKLNAVLSARQLDADKLIATVDGQKLTPRAAIAALLSAAADSMRPPIPTQIGFGIDSVTLGGAALQDLRGDLEIAQGGANLTGFELRAPGFTRLQAGGRIDFGGRPNQLHRPGRSEFGRSARLRRMARRQGRCRKAAGEAAAHARRGDARSRHGSRSSA